MGRLIKLDGQDEPLNITETVIASMKNLLSDKLYSLKYDLLMKHQKATVNKECFLFFTHCAEKIQGETF
jgi:hypothetical protein